MLGVVKGRAGNSFSKAILDTRLEEGAGPVCERRRKERLKRGALERIVNYDIKSTSSRPS
jgi:hypothetical protein